MPANVPVNLYWSATIYDRETHTLIRDLPWSSRSSHSPGLQENADGSVEIAFGPQPPPDRPQNWIPTDPGGAFEVIFRFYGPEKALFDKSWQLPDIQSAACTNATKRLQVMRVRSAPLVIRQRMDYLTR